MTNPLPQELDTLSQRLVNARATAGSLPEYPGELPTNLHDAYAIQSASITRWPDEVAGWKVGMVPPEYRQPLAAERLSGPIFRSSVFAIEPGAAKTMSIFREGFAAVEAEFVFRIGTTIEPEEKEYSDDALADLVSDLHVGIEIASSPLPLVNVLGPCCVVSDFGNNAGLLVGPSIPNWRALPADSLKVQVTVDGDIVGSADSSSIEGGLLQALRFLVTLCARRGIALAEGTYVSCGAVTGIHDVTVDSKSVVDFGAFGVFTIDYEPIAPLQPRTASAEG